LLLSFGKTIIWLTSLNFDCCVGWPLGMIYELYRKKQFSEQRYVHGVPNRQKNPIAQPGKDKSIIFEFNCWTVAISCNGTANSRM
jgi:hypothetical protein